MKNAPADRARELLSNEGFDPTDVDRALLVAERNVVDRIRRMARIKVRNLSGGHIEMSVADLEAILDEVRP